MQGRIVPPEGRREHSRACQAARALLPLRSRYKPGKCVTGVFKAFQAVDMFDA